MMSGKEQTARGWIIASRERLIVLCRVEEQSAPEIRASATPRRGGGTAVPFYEGGSGGQPTDPKAGERWRHVWCARQNRLPLFAVWRLDERVKCARGSSTVGCCVWAFGTVGRTRSSSGDSGPHRSACTAHLGASGGPNSFAGASPPRRRIVGAAATRLPRTIHRCGGGRRASTETAAELVLLLRGGHRL